ncbi:uncharacterized protein LOC142335213 [Convolutriloba macropyga]|uniref:uncharacterized protein LOC142335213 n=1 Tax=Convolutriloba macropyga TaxID=536237 RepID=UPI003F5263DE
MKLKTVKSLCCSTCYSKHPITDLKRCSLCQVAIYCSRGCQKGDWPKHKLHCKDLKAFVATSAKEEERITKIEDVEYREQLIKEKQIMSEWVEKTDFPEEWKIRQWLSLALDQDPNFIYALGSFGSKNDQLLMFNYNYARAIYEGYVDVYCEEPIVHFGRLRQIGWKIWDELGFKGMQFYYYLNMRMVVDKSLFNDANQDGNLEQNSWIIPPNYLMSKNVEYVWDKVGGWLA